LEKFQELWSSFERFGEVSRDLEKFRGIWRVPSRIRRCSQGLGEVLRDLEKFLGIWRSFKGFGEVSRDFEKF